MSQGFTGSDKNTLLNHIVNGRLTLTSGTPVTTSDVTAATAIYFTPYKGNRIFLYNTTSTKWELFEFSEISIAVPATTATNYDVWAYNSSGSVTLEVLAWTNATTRATAIALQNGVYVKSGDASRRYLGSFRTTAVSGQTEDSETKRFIWNYYNRVARYLLKTESTTSWTYTSQTWRSLNNSTTNRIELIIGVLEDSLMLNCACTYTNAGTNSWGTLGIGEDTTSDNSIYLKGLFGNAGTTANLAGNIFFNRIATEFYPSSIGYHYYQVVEQADSGTNTMTSYGNATSTLKERTTGINGTIIG